MRGAAAGKDLDYFELLEQPHDELFIMHVRSLTAFTTLEELLCFCSEVLPLIRRKQPPPLGGRVI